MNLDFSSKSVVFLSDNLFWDRNCHYFDCKWMNVYLFYKFGLFVWVTLWFWPCLSLFHFQLWCHLHNHGALCAVSVAMWALSTLLTSWTRTCFCSIYLPFRPTGLPCWCCRRSTSSWLSPCWPANVFAT